MIFPLTRLLTAPHPNDPGLLNSLLLPALPICLLFLLSSLIADVVGKIIWAETEK